jgi:hypothetical protein
MQSMDFYIKHLNTSDIALPKQPSEYECLRLLWIKVILRAAYDWVLYRDSKNHITRNKANDAYRWLFNSTTIKKTFKVGKIVRTCVIQESNSLENICDAIDLDIDSVRKFAKRLTRADIKKLEFLDRNTKIKNEKNILNTKGN